MGALSQTARTASSSRILPSLFSYNWHPFNITDCSIRTYRFFQHVTPRRLLLRSFTWKVHQHGIYSQRLQIYGDRDGIIMVIYNYKHICCNKIHAKVVYDFTSPGLGKGLIFTELDLPWQMGAYANQTTHRCHRTSTALRDVTVCRTQAG